MGAQGGQGLILSEGVSMMRMAFPPGRKVLLLTTSCVYLFVYLHVHVAEEVDRCAVVAHTRLRGTSWLQPSEYAIQLDEGTMHKQPVPCIR